MQSSAKKQGTHLFIDTNVLLNFYAYSKDDLDQLEKLVEILKTKVVKLYVTQQVVDEFYRNRDSKLAESFDSFRALGSTSCPSFMTSLPEYEKYKTALNEYKVTRTALSEKAREQADNRELLADRLFEKILEQAAIIPIDHLISRDGDFSSKLNPTQAKVFLIDEWKKVMKSTLHLHEQISLFFKSNYPDQDLSLEIEKRESIDALLKSSNFATTHAAIASLTPYISFLTAEEAEEVIQGALSNSQVAWIVGDSDVEAFLKNMLDSHRKDLSPTLLGRLEEALGAFHGCNDPRT